MNPHEKFEIIVPEEYDNERIDKFLTNSLELDFSRTFIQKLIKGKNISITGKDIKQNYKVKTDDAIVFQGDARLWHRQARSAQPADHP